MKQTHRTPSAVQRTAAWLLLLSAVAITHLSCSDAETPTGSNTDTGSYTDTAGTDSVTYDENAETTAAFSLPADLDYGETVFTVLAVDEDVPYTYLEDYDAENGDIMDDSIYRRNRIVEEYLNVRLEIVNCKHGDEAKKIQNDAASGDGLYDLASPHILSQIPTLVTGGLLLDLNELTYVDFSQPWWYGSFLDTMQIKGKNFYASGSMISPNVRVIVFNKQLAENYDLPDLYETVTQGKWTLDTMAVYTKDFYKDLNGNSVKDKEDMYAFSDLSNTGLATSFLHGSDFLFVESTGDTYSLKLAEETEKVSSVMERLYDSIYMDGNTDITNQEFANGTVLFGTQVLLKLQMLRDSDVSFGIIPFPKYDEAQKDYHSSAWNGLVCVPVSASDPDLSGAVMEALAYYSTDTLVPAYYEKLLGGKFAQDDASVRMLDLIFGSLVYDIGLCFDGFVGYYSLPGSLLISGSTDLASAFAKKEPVFQKQYDALYASVE